MTELCSLPLEKVFPIQIGTELFRLSGASIASDGMSSHPGVWSRGTQANEAAPSYFSRFFETQLQQNEDLRTLYIDRDPETFKQIALHLQGYHIEPRDNSEFVKLFADAQFYSLPRLTSQLFASDVYIQIEDTHFRIPRDLFSTPGNTPNYFSLGFGAFFASPREVFPGLDRKGLLRPPAIEAPRLAHRSAAVFGDILHLARGYPLAIRNGEHRAQIVRDCRYFNLKGLEQRVIACDVGWNPLRRRGEITIGVEDVVVRGVGVDPATGVVTYARPFTDDDRNDLIVQVKECVVDRHTGGVEFLGSTREVMTKLLKTVNVQGAGAGAGAGAGSQTPVRAVLTGDTDVVVNGQVTSMPEIVPETVPKAVSDNPRKRPRVDETEDGNDADRGTDGGAGAGASTWIVETGQWLLRISQTQTELVAVKLDVYTSTRERTRKRVFLS